MLSGDPSGATVSVKRGAFRKMARDNPGALTQMGLRTLREYISAVGGSISEDEFAPIVLHYLLSVFHPQFPPGVIGEESTRELRTYAQVIDSILAGRTVSALDTLFQRFKAKTQAVTDGTWQTAKWLELIPMNIFSVASPEELEIAVKSFGTQAKLEELQRKG